ncbi:MAG: aspartate carbamoyltransferase regulatory subunit [Treponema sp.]|nr:aspartate carbamoyltransferase regulatory subunit [Treponema sp.]MBO7637357.1 aspartate carbamoyltransferase regulatory subunit [Treponema sp.]MBP5450851.1 aspartate carbamoyltransferase regulatory subunit [Treponema sp.]
MINIAEIKNGLVIDHIHAGTGWKVFKWLGLDNVKFSCALIINAASQKTGTKDIIKIDNIINIDYSVLGFIDSNITVNVIQDSKIVRKIKMELPEKVENVIQCKNPRCITITEHYVPQEFRLVDKEKKQYRCVYCDAMYTAGTVGVE